MAPHAQLSLPFRAGLSFRLWVRCDFKINGEENGFLSETHEKLLTQPYKSKELRMPQTLIEYGRARVRP